MKQKIVVLAGLAALACVPPAQGMSLLRIKCAEADLGAGIYINNVLKGQCPMDVAVTAGKVRVRASRIQQDTEYFVEKTLDVLDSVPQRLFLELTESRLTPQAIARRAAEEAQRQKTAAEAGNIKAMRVLADYYERGHGLGKSLASAKHWREQADKTEVEGVHRQAESGDVAAMRDLIVRYEQGNGVPASAAQAAMWEARLAQEEARLAVVAEEEDRQRRLEAIEWMSATNYLGREAVKLSNEMSDDVSSAMTSFMISLPVIAAGVATDAVAAPFKTTEIQRIKNEAALRPSTWAEPDSMIAKASIQRANEGHGEAPADP